jgi:oligopeptidase B
VGRRIYDIQFKDLRTGKLLPDVVRATTPNLAWSTDNQTVFYTKQDLQTLRWEKVYRHKLGADAAKDALVFHEKDDTFYAGVSRSKSRKYIIIGSGNNSSMTSESLYLEAANPTGSFKVFLPRQKGHQYDLDHANGKFYIRTNDGAQNFKLMSTAEGSTAKANWKEVVPHRPDVLLEGFELFKDFLVLQERGNALTRIQVRPWTGGGDHFLDFGEPAYTASVAFNPEYNTKTLRYNYTSMTTPQSVYDYDMAARTRQLMKQTEVLGGFDSKNYQTERLYATATDGTKVPISLVYRKGIKKDGSTRCSCTATAPTAFRWTPRSVRRRSACSTGASCTPLPTSGAGRRMAAPGTRTASSTRRKTRSRTLSPARSTCRKKVSAGPNAPLRWAAAPGACSWAPS